MPVLADRLIGNLSKTALIQLADLSLRQAMQQHRFQFQQGLLIVSRDDAAGALVIWGGGEAPRHSRRSVGLSQPATASA